MVFRGNCWTYCVIFFFSYAEFYWSHVWNIMWRIIEFFFMYLTLSRGGFRHSNCFQPGDPVTALILSSPLSLKRPLPIKLFENNNIVNIKYVCDFYCQLLITLFNKLLEKERKINGLKKLSVYSVYLIVYFFKSK